mgnify:CR=1 FL=1
MKIALCISGLARCFEETYINQRNNLIEPNDCDIFLYTSDFVSEKHSQDNPYKGKKFLKYSDLIIGDVAKRKNKNHIIGTAYNLDSKKLEEKIISVYGDRVKKIHIEKETLEENYSAGWDDADRLTGKNWFSTGKNWAWTKKMFEKTYKCNKMFMKYCKENNKKYDFVIRSRMDLTFKKEINIKNFEPANNNVYAFGGWNPSGTLEKIGYKEYFFDGFAVAKPEDMEKYCNFWEQESEIAGKPQGMEPQLHHYLESVGLKYKSIGNTKKKTQKLYVINRLKNK